MSTIPTSSFSRRAVLLHALLCLAAIAATAFTTHVLATV